MAKPPKIDAEQMGALIDTFTTINAAMFTALADDEQVAAMQRLLDRLRAEFEGNASDPTNALRAFVLESTVTTLKGLQLMQTPRDPSGVQ